jgi:hypothetical protein
MPGSTRQLKLDRAVGADNAVSNNKTDDETDPSTVTLSRSEGSVWIGSEMLPQGVTLSRSEGV